MGRNLVRRRQIWPEVTSFLEKTGFLFNNLLKKLSSSQETQLLPMVLLRWFSSWFLISKRNIQVHQKDTLDLVIHSNCLKALNDGGCLRLNQVLSRKFKVKSPPLTSSTPPKKNQHVLEGNAVIGRLFQSKTNGQYHVFSAPSPTRD